MRSFTLSLLHWGGNRILTSNCILFLAIGIHKWVKLILALGFLVVLALHFGDLILSPLTHLSSLTCGQRKRKIDSCTCSPEAGTMTRGTQTGQLGWNNDGQRVTGLLEDNRHDRKVTRQKVTLMQNCSNKMLLLWYLKQIFNLVTYIGVHVPYTHIPGDVFRYLKQNFHNLMLQN